MSDRPAGSEIGDACQGGPDVPVMSSTEVVVKDDAGKTVGKTEVGKGKVASDNGVSKWCEFEWSIEDLPAGRGFYEIFIGKFGSITVNEEDLNERLEMYVA